VESESSDGVGTGDVSSDGGVDGGGGGLLVKSARSFLKRMTKAFAGGGGKKDGGAGGVDAWDAAQTVILLGWIEVADICICARKSIILEKNIATLNPYHLQLHHTLVRAIEEHADLKSKVQDLLPQYASHLIPNSQAVFVLCLTSFCRRYREILIDVLVQAHAADPTARERHRHTSSSSHVFLLHYDCLLM
jgi:hypothetical protein